MSLFYLRPAIILPFLWVLIALHYLLIMLSPLVRCCASPFLQYGSLYCFFLKAFSFVCILCTLLLRGCGAGKRGTDNALWNRVQLWLHRKGWRWLFWVDVFRQGKEENPGWRRLVWKGPKQMEDMSFSVCVNLISYFFKEINFFSNVDILSKWKFLLLWRLYTSPSKLCLTYILLFCLYMEFFSPPCPVLSVFLNDSPPPFFVI